MNIQNKDRIIPQKPIVITENPYRYHRHHTYYYKGKEADKAVILNYLREECQRQEKLYHGSHDISIPQLVSDIALSHSFSVSSIKKVLIDLCTENSANVCFIPTSSPVIVHLCHPKQDHIMLNMCIHGKIDRSYFTHIHIRNFEEVLK